MIIPPFVISALWGPVWVRLAPFLAPLIKWGVPWLLPVWRALRGFSGHLLPLALVSIAFLVFVWSLSAVFSRPSGPQVVTVDAVKASRLEAENRALRAAYDRQSRIMASREAERAREAADRQRFEQEQERAREESNAAQSGDGRRAFISADDPWLRAKAQRAGQPSGPGRR